MRHDRRRLGLFFALLLALALLGIDSTILFHDENNNFKAALIAHDEGLGSFFQNYRKIPWLGVQHPPLQPLTTALVVTLFGADLVAVRLVFLGFGLGTLLLTYALGQRLYDRRGALWAVLLLPTFPLFARMGLIAMSDMPLTFFFLLALYLGIRLHEQPRAISALLLGLVLGVGLLFKYTMAFAYPILVGYTLLHGIDQRRAIHMGGAMLVGGSLLGAWLLYASHLNVLERQSRQMGIYIGLVARTPYGRSRLLSFLLQLPSSLGLYQAPILLAGLWQTARRFSAADRFLLLWVGLVILPVMATVPDVRYCLPAFPALALLGAQALLRLERVAAPALALGLIFSLIAFVLYAHLPENVPLHAR